MSKQRDLSVFVSPSFFTLSSFLPWRRSEWGVVNCLGWGGLLDAQGCIILQPRDLSLLSGNPSLSLSHSHTPSPFLSDTHLHLSLSLSIYLSVRLTIIDISMHTHSFKHMTVDSVTTISFQLVNYHHFKIYSALYLTLSYSFTFASQLPSQLALSTDGSQR